MSTTEKIIKYIRRSKQCSGSEIARHFNISRQAVNKHLKELVLSGKISKQGTTKGALYRLGPPKKTLHKWKKTLGLKDLHEDTVFSEIAVTLNLRASLPANVFETLNYAFTEMLNNAIDHSRSEKCQIEFKVDDYNCYFEIRDYGIGVFHSIVQKFDLVDESEAVQELLKGKTTTMPQRHSGEGIFFTSRAGDAAWLRSHRIELSFDNLGKDVFVAEKRSQRGTLVGFRISKNAKRKLDDLFHSFAPDEFDYQFMRTNVLVHLFKKELFSRSEAKRLLHGLDKFKEIILDFKGVKTIGQAFADELFRVYKNNHPEIKISYRNTTPLIEAMILHVVDNII
jgi:biotin operon repressor/anti-sigma regulatory factor (Ser/Thr protein kinase)